MTSEEARPILLIVDDIPINIQILAGELREEYQIKIATRGEKALEIARVEPSPDLILLDIMMPEMDGYEACRRLKQDPRTRSIPIIFITAKGDVEDETLGFDLGAADYITKPFQLPVVKARIRTHLSLKRKTDLLEQLAFLDGLTDIPNRRRFEEVLKDEWRRAMRSGQPLSLVLMDLDNFKAYNDEYGHAAGDACLIQVAQALKRSLKRPADFVARYGGEEFVAILPDTDRPSASFVAERMRAEIEALAIPHAPFQLYDHITLSLGVATILPDRVHSPVDLINSADRMLYAAKTDGRNQAKAIHIE